MNTASPPIITNIPESPGIYHMLNAAGEILYIGKAKNLKKRVASYFSNRSDRDIKTAVLVQQIARVETIVTDSEADALILENQLIKRHLPRYNILLKDDKNYPWLKITAEPFPRLLIVRQKDQWPGKYFGPYPSLGSTRQMNQWLIELFPLRTCKQRIDLTQTQPKCLRLDLKLCAGPCINKTVKAEYDQIIAELVLFLNGRNEDLFSQLEADMQARSRALEFEKAAQIRDKISRIRLLLNPQNVDLQGQQNFHVWSTAANEHFYYILFQGYRQGQLVIQKGLYADAATDTRPEWFWESSILDFYTGSEEVPDDILCEPALEPLFAQVQAAVPARLARHILSPKRGQKLETLALAQKNARMSLLRITRDYLIQTELDGFPRLCELKNELALTRTPMLIFGFDISHFGGRDIVASAVAFRAGKPAKALYRRFRIRSVSGRSDDPKSMFEVVSRRIRMCVEKQEPLPDLILIDGGKAQIREAHRAIRECSLSQHIDIISLAKREEELYCREGTRILRLDRTDSALRLLQSVRDESHRFGLEYQRKQRLNHMKSRLAQIPGLGDKRINRLYQAYDTIDAMRIATPEDMARIGKMGTVLASEVLRVLRDEF